MLDLGEGELRWHTPNVLGDEPICGNRHASVLLDEHTQPNLSCMLVFAADMHDTFATLYALRFRDGPQGNGLRWAPQQTTGKAPLSRTRPSLVLLDHHVFVVCGVAAGRPLASVAMVDTRNFSWSSPVVDGIPPPARMGATATRAGTDLYIFGGSDGKASLRDLNVLVYVTWFAPAYGGRQPPARVGHTLTFVGSKLYLLGGASHGAAYNDLFVLDPTTQMWARPPMYGVPPDALVGHSAVAVGTEIIIWGGGDGKRAHAGLNVVDVANMLWSKPMASGSEPLAHVGHSAVHADAKMYVFGGYGQRQYYNELVVLDTGIMVWLRPHTVGAPPSPCVLHSANIISLNSGAHMVVYGGAFDEKPIDQIHTLDIATMRWQNFDKYVWEGPRPEPRFGHGACAVGTRLFIFGGTTGGVADSWASYFSRSGFVSGYSGGARNDLCVANLQSRTFSMPRYGGQRPPPAYRVGAATYRGKLFIFGGVGSNAQVAVLDTGHHATADGAQGAQGAQGGTVLGDVAAEFLASEGIAATRPKAGLGGRAAEASRGLDATAAAALVSLLQALGLNKYARLFLRQEVDVDSLLHLSETDLKDMGLSAIGARRKLTAAIHRHKLQRRVGADVGGADPAAGGGEKGGGRGGGGGGRGGGGGSAAGDSAADGEHAPATPAGGGHPTGSQGGVAIAGEVFRGRYKLNGKTYLGGSARVVLGEDMKIGRPVAVKVHSSRAYFAREVKLLKHLQCEYVVAFLDSYDEESTPPTLILEGGSCSLAEILSEGQLAPVERKMALERLCLAVDFVHSKNFVLVDLKPQNVVVFGSLLSLKLIDLECLRKAGEPIPFKLTPFYASPELATAALETMRLGQLPALEFHRMIGAADRWGPNLQKLALLSENPTLSRAVAAASTAANRAGDGRGELNRDDLKQLEAPLKMANGKPLRAHPAMDVWALGACLFVPQPPAPPPLLSQPSTLAWLSKGSPDPLAFSWPLWPQAAPFAHAPPVASRPFCPCPSCRCNLHLHAQVCSRTSYSSTSRSSLAAPTTLPCKCSRRRPRSTCHYPASPILRRSICSQRFSSSQQSSA